VKWSKLAVITLAAVQISAVIPPRPIERVPPMPPPAVSAPAFILYDETNDIVLAELDADSSRPMASTTKLMTGLLAVESGRMDETVTVSARATSIGEASIGLVAGERLPMEDLVFALLLRSGNDAATAVAEHLGGSVEGFVAMMNARASELGMSETSFANPHGLDVTGHHSSPRDLLTLARAVADNPRLAEMMALTRHPIPNAPDGTVRVAESTNQLLSTYRGTFVGKTGFTFRAGLVYAGGAEREGRRLYVVVMGSEGAGGHFSDAAALLDHGFEDLRFVDTIRRGTPFVLAAPDRSLELTRLAALQTLVLVSSLDTLPPEPPEPAEPPAEELSASALPGLAEALGWFVGGLFGG
jgi:serine-type D-Ala-D-Ala carboxypeptidase (penicillin-binding protein 5/6)